uniref:UBC core domain-containing protein n=1 Tax=Lactuca sativa TaxID=4236 RepID=A0A9R1W3E6_LACSA|nr:hypothetical protein LSAT_V11C300138430 [Lactuca sativa]
MRMTYKTIHLLLVVFCNFSGLVEEDMFYWQAIINVTLECPFPSGVFLVSVNFPPDYPFKTSKFKDIKGTKVSKLYHLTFTRTL